MTRLLKTPRLTRASAGNPGSPPSPGYPAVDAHWETVTYYDTVPGWTEWVATGVTLPGYWSDTLGDGNTAAGAPGPYWIPPSPQYVRVDYPAGEVARTTRVWVPARPAIPASPGVPYTPPTPAQAVGAAWDAGATSLHSASGDVTLTFTADAAYSIGIVCGLATHRQNNDYNDIEAGVYISHGQVTPIESGALAPAGQIFSGRGVINITLRNGVATYSVNGTAFYTSLLGGLGTVYVRAELYGPGDYVDLTSLSSAATLTNCAGELHGLTTVSADRSYAVSAGKLHPLKMRGGNAGGIVVEGGIHALAGLSADHPYTAAVGQLQPLETSAADIVRTASAGTLRPLEAVTTWCGSAGGMAPLTGMAADRAYAVAVGELRPLVGVARRITLRPHYCVSIADIAPVNGDSRVVPGEVITSSGALPPLRGKSADHPYAESTAELPCLSGSAADVRRRTGYFSGAVRHRFTLDAYAREQPPNSVTPTMPSPTLLAFAGATIEVASPTAGLLISGEFAVYGTAALVSPTPTVSAAGTLTELGAVRAKSARVQLTAFGGGAATLSSPAATATGEATEAITGEGVLIPRYAPSLTGFAGAVLTRPLLGPATITASATVGSIGTAQLLAPTPTLVATSSEGIYGVARLMLPMPEVKAAPNRAALLMPRAWLLADGTSVPAQVSGAWVFGIGSPQAADPANPLDNHPASRYLNFPFLHIVRRNGDYYGIGPTGIYRLGGDTDAGAPIAWEVETAVNDFGSVQLKRMTSAYFGAHLGPSAMATVIVGERGSNQCPHPNVRGMPIQNHRVVFGKGMRSRYYGVRIDDASGGELHINSIDLAVINLTRKI